MLEFYDASVMACKYCDTTLNQIKYGKTKSGKQRYKCKSCKRTYSVEIVRPCLSSGLTSLEVCAGAGGQALGLEQAGFHHLALVEIDPRACQTLRLNRPQWNVYEVDLKTFDATQYRGLDLLAGGLPCPPFSVAGKQLGADDERNLFGEMLRLVRQCQPKAVMIENVRGLLDKVFDSFRSDVNDELESIGYVVSWNLVQASDYGVPQLRPRAIMVALLPEYAPYFSWPKPCPEHTPTVGEVLFEDMSADGWAGASMWRKQADDIAPTLVGGSKKHGGPDLGPTRAKHAWRKLGVDGRKIAYDPPAADFVGMPNLTVKMAAKIQGFPDSWHFVGKKTPAYRQIGNAFPPPVARAIGESIADALSKRCAEVPDEVMTAS